MQHKGGGNTEETMVMLLRQNDQQSFFQLYDHYAPLISGIIKSIIDNKENAENVLKAIFEQLWSNKRNFDTSKETMFSWIYTLTTKIALRSRKLRGENASITPDQEEKIALELILVHGYSFHEITDQLNLSPDHLRSSIRTALKTYQTSPPQ